MTKPIIIVDGVYYNAHSEKKLGDNIEMPCLYNTMELLENIKFVSPLQCIDYKDILEQ